MKKRNFKQDLFIYGLLAASGVATAVTGYQLKKTLDNLRQDAKVREYDATQDHDVAPILSEEEEKKMLLELINNM